MWLRGGGGVVLGRCDQQVAEKEAVAAAKGRDDKEYMAWLLASHEQRHRVDTAEGTVRRMVARQQAADNMAEVEAKAERKVQERLMELEQDATEQYNTYHRCVYERDVKEVHTSVCRQLPSALLSEKWGFGAYESEVSSPSIRRISAMCGWRVCWHCCSGSLPPLFLEREAASSWRLGGLIWSGRWTEAWKSEESDGFSCEGASFWSPVAFS